MSIDILDIFRFFEKLQQGQWCHVFPEGRVWQNWRFEKNEPILGPFKIGVGKLIAHCTTNPVIIPIYHKGMDSVVPEKRPAGDKLKTKRAMPPKSILPRIGNNIEVWVGTPFNLTEKVNTFNAQYPGMLSSWQSTPETIGLYTELTNDVREKMIELEAEAWERKT